MLSQWHVKDPGHSTKSAIGRLHLKHAYILDIAKSEWADYEVKAWCGNLLGKRGHTQLVRDIRPQSSQLAEPLWIYPGLKSGTGVHELFSPEKRCRRVIHQNSSPQILVCDEKPSSQMELSEKGPHRSSLWSQP